MQFWNIRDNYWLADDGRVFGSAKQVITTSSDPDYVAWTGANNVPNAWPRDAAGNQTDAALDQVVGQHLIFVNLKYYTANKRWRTEQGGITLASGMPIKTDDRAQAKINGTRLVAEGNASLSTNWQAADGTFWPLTSAEVIAMSDALQTHINNCFATSADVAASIDAGDITTRAQVDAAFDQPMTQARKDWLKTAK